MGLGTLNGPGGGEFKVVGYIVPGLIAYWMERQGVVRTIAITLIASVMTRLFIIIITGGKIPL